MEAFGTRFILYSAGVGIVLMTLKPSTLFDETGRVRPFALTPAEISKATFLPYYVIVPVLGGIFALLF